LTDQLRPPAGFALDNAVGTTFTMSLNSALAIPLAFAAQRLAADDPIGVLDAVRRAASKIDVFAQAGQVSIATPPTDLVAFLEPMVHPVAVRRGIFHPKVWFLEYSRGEERTYRFVCASRNLTAYQSWDTVVTLDGVAGGGQEARVRNRPLTLLLSALSDLAISPLAPERRARIGALAQRWQTVEWERPDDVKDVAFHVWGNGERPELDVSGKRALFISPFVSDGGLAELRRGTRTDSHLVSRAETLNLLSDQPRLHTWVLDDAADPAEDQPVQGDALHGLHAKVFVFDRWDGAHVFMGSLNATDAALHQNVEVLLELTGNLNKLGVEATRAALGSLITPHVRASPIDSPDEEVGLRLERALQSIAAVAFHARVQAGDSYSLDVWVDEQAKVTDDVEVSWYLLTRPAAVIAGLPGNAAGPFTVAGLELAEVTPYIVISARQGDIRRTTVVLASLDGDPDDRREAVLARHLSEPGALLRLLMLMLELAGVSVGAGVEGAGWNRVGSGGDGSGLFEALVRAVASEHSSLPDVQRIVAYVTTHKEESLPPGFAELWSVAWAAYEAREAGARG
jgi:hypothetical protein